MANIPELPEPEFKHIPGPPSESEKRLMAEGEQKLKVFPLITDIIAIENHCWELKSKKERLEYLNLVLQKYRRFVDDHENAISRDSILEKQLAELIQQVKLKGVTDALSKRAAPGGAVRDNRFIEKYETVAYSIDEIPKLYSAPDYSFCPSRATIAKRMNTENEKEDPSIFKDRKGEWRFKKKRGKELFGIILGVIKATERMKNESIKTMIKELLAQNDPHGSEVEETTNLASSTVHRSAKIGRSDR